MQRICLTLFDDSSRIYTMPNDPKPQQPPTPVRMPDDLKAALLEQARTNDRSLNGEIVNRLRASLGRQKKVKPQQGESC